MKYTYERVLMLSPANGNPFTLHDADPDAPVDTYSACRIYKTDDSAETVALVGNPSIACKVVDALNIYDSLDRKLRGIKQDAVDVPFRIVESPGVPDDQVVFVHADGLVDILKIEGK